MQIVGHRLGEGAVTVSVAAPVDYVPREFILHLYGALCRAIAGDDADRGSRPEMLRRVLVLQLVTMLVAGGVLLIVFDDRLPSLSAGQVLGTTLLAAAALLFVFVLMPYLTSGFFGAQPMSGTTVLSYGLVREARTRLERIRYLQSVSIGWSGELKLPIGQAGLTRGKTLNEQQTALPDLIGEFRAFATTVAQTASGGLVIGIDELDKIAGTDDAQQFMNDIKGVFGIPNCFFLISISEDALANFDRRGVPVRDAFDSSLDDVVRVSYLQLDGTRRLLQRRVVGLGQGFICLSQTIASGLPRDVIRVARAIVQCRSDEGPPPTLRQVAERVLSADFHAKRRATIVAITSFAPLPEVAAIVAWLHDLEMPKQLVGAAALTPPPLALANARPATDLQSFRLVSLLADEFAAFSYVILTTYEIFAGFTPEALAASASTPPPTVFDTLAAARQALTVHPRLAWEKTSSLRVSRERQVSAPPLPLTGIPTSS